MKDDHDESAEESGGEVVAQGRGWDPTSFLTGILVGAAVGAGLALLFAPGSGDETRRLIRRRARAVTDDAAEGLVSARDEARQALREKKEALRHRLARGIERAGEELGV
jgi:gas vesicle protein